MTMAGPEPEWLVKGDNAWQMLAGTLVGLQSVPGLVILYGSIVKKKWAVNSAFMALYAFAAVLVCWALVGFRMSFGDQMLPMWGWPNTILGPKYLTQQAKYHNQPQDLFFPMSTLIYYQFAFAALTVILIAGSILGRMNFWAWMMFVPLWLLFSYTVGAFSLWGGGFLFQLGVIDFSGGYVIHVSSGVAGLVAAYWVGPRLPQDRERFPPNNVLLMLCGAGILWLGWNGFNGGAPYAAGQDASLAILNTNLSAATALLTWTALDIFYFRKPSVIGAVQGMFAGLVCITPGAGLVHGWVAMVYGIAAGTVPWFTMMKLHRQIRFLAQIDDTLGVFHTHAVAGVIGGLLTGLFATQDMCFIFGCKKEVHQNRGPQVLKQLAGALFVAGWNVVITSIILLVIRLVVPLRMSDEQLAVGDDAAHGEEAYALWEDGDRYDDSVRSKYDESVRSKFDDPSVRGPWNADSRDVEMQRQIAEHQHQHHLPNNHAMAVFAMSTKSPPVLMATSSPGMAIRAPDHRSPTKIG